MSIQTSRRRPRVADLSEAEKEARRRYKREYARAREADPAKREARRRYQREYKRTREADPAKKEARRQYMREYTRAKMADPEWRARVAQCARTSYQVSPVRREQRAEARRKRQAVLPADKVARHREQIKAWHATHKAYENNPEARARVNEARRIKAKAKRHLARVFRELLDIVPYVQ